MIDIENELTSTLDAAADAMPPSDPPAFCWQHPARISRRSLRRPGPALTAVGAGLVAAAVAAAIAVTSMPSHSASHRSIADPRTAATHPGTAQSEQPIRSRSAPALLLAAAHTRLSRGDLPLATGQYRYIRTVGPAPDQLTYPAGSPNAVTTKAPAGSYTLDELWVPKDETRTWLRRQSTPHDPSAGPSTQWRGRCGDLYANTQDGPKGDACNRPGSFEDPTPKFIAALPRDASQLYRRLHRYAEGRLNPDKIHDVNFAMFTAVNDLLSSGQVTSDLTSSLYGVLSKIPGIVVVDGARNASGRSGTGFRLGTVLGRGHDASRDTSTIIVDLGSGDYIGYGEKSPGNDYLDAVTVGVADRLGGPGH